MPKNRTIPFGYCMKNGEITTEPKEVYAVVTIFDEYLKGRSLSEIAKLMQTEKIESRFIEGAFQERAIGTQWLYLCGIGGSAETGYLGELREREIGRAHV